VETLHFFLQVSETVSRGLHHQQVFARRFQFSLPCVVRVHRTPQDVDARSQLFLNHAACDLSAFAQRPARDQHDAVPSTRFHRFPPPVEIKPRELPLLSWAK
jgi:hypothetical protein